MSDSPGNRRNLRCKERRTYTDHEVDDEIDGKRTYTLDDKLESDKYNSQFVRTMTGNDVTLKYFQNSGFTTPLLIKEKSGLGLRVPSENFHVSDVKRCVGSRRILDVMDVNTQKGFNMSMKEWVKYYEDNTQRERLLNVISLEFSHTKLETYVQQPDVVRQMDWVENTWPQYLKELQQESTNLIDKMMYPKVQKYTLMSVAGCYTDFHIDMGGTSVWYHILHGQKIFWLIPPTPENISAYESWTMSANQGEVFFGDTVTGCQRVTLHAGYTFFIPSGWIHAVYTPVDSLVFGGNFLHSYNISTQLLVWNVEGRTHVAGKFRYPLFMEIHWYLLQRYVSCLMGKDHRKKSAAELAQEAAASRKNSRKKIIDDVDLGDDRSNDSQISDSSMRSSMKLSDIDDIHSAASKTPRGVCSTASSDIDDDIKIKSHVPIIMLKCVSVKLENCDNAMKGGRLSPASTAAAAIAAGSPTSGYHDKSALQQTSSSSASPYHTNGKWFHLTKHELKGLKELVDWLSFIPRTKWNVPSDIPEPDELLVDSRRLLKEHANDDHELAVSGETFLKWPPKKVKATPKPHTPKGERSQKPDWKNRGKGKEASGSRHRRVRCKTCEPCTRAECRECKFCRDMKKFGGPGTMKQCCVSKQCLAPNLPNSVVCGICSHQEVSEALRGSELIRHGDVDVRGGALHECSLCWEIVHPYCSRDKERELSGSDYFRQGLVNEDVPSSWECPKCADQEKLMSLKRESIEADKENLSDSCTSTSPASARYSSTTGGDNSRLHGLMDGRTIGDDGSSRDPSPHKRDSPPITSTSNTHIGIHTNNHTHVAATPSTITHPTSPTHNRTNGQLSPESPVKHHNSTTSHRTNENRLLLSQHHPITTSTPIAATSPVNSSGAAAAMITQPHRSMSPNIMLSSSLALSPSVVLSKSLNTSHPFSHTVSSAEAGDGTNGAVTPSKRKGGKGGSAEQQQKKLKSSPSSPNKRNLKGGAARGIKEEVVCKKEADTGLGGTVTQGPGGVHSTQQNHACRALPVKYIVRPAPPTDQLMYHTPAVKVDAACTDSSKIGKAEWTHIFTYLSPSELCTAMLVCKAWCQWAIHPRLWKRLLLSRQLIKKNCLIGIVRRQPGMLDLSWTNMNARQSYWLFARLPQLKSLHFRGNHWTAVSALCGPSCPLLHELDLAWCQGVKDECMYDLVLPPVNHRPGVDCSVSRLRNMTSLCLSGTDISDSTLSVLCQHLPTLMSLDVSFCVRVTNKGIAFLSDKRSLLRCSVERIDVSSCKQLTEDCLKSLALMPALCSLTIVDCPSISIELCERFMNTYNSRKASYETPLVVTAYDKQPVGMCED